MSLDSCAGTGTGLGKITPAIVFMITEALICFQVCSKFHPAIGIVGFAQVFHSTGTNVGNHYGIQSSADQIHFRNLHRRNPRMLLIKSHWRTVRRRSAYRVALILQIGVDLNAVGAAICISRQNHFSQSFPFAFSCLCLKNIGNRGNAATS